MPRLGEVLPATAIHGIDILPSPLRLNCMHVPRVEICRNLPVTLSYLSRCWIEFSNAVAARRPCV